MRLRQRRLSARPGVLRALQGLGERLATWDAVVAAPAVSQHALDQQLDAMMAERKVKATEAEVSYNVPAIKTYAHLVAMEQASGRLPEARHFEWTGFTTAGHPDVPGPPYGVLKVIGSATDWIPSRPSTGSRGRLAGPHRAVQAASR